MKINWHYILLQAIVFIWGFTGILGKAIESNIFNMLVYRTFVAASVLWLLFFLLRQKLPEKTLLKKMITSGFILGCSWICFFGSARLANVSVSVIGIATSPIFVVVIQSFIGKAKRKLLLSEFLLGIVSLAGIYIIFSDKDFHYWNGLMVSMLSGLLTAIYSTMTEHLAHKENHIKIVTFQITTAFWVMLATLLCFHYALPQFNIRYEMLNTQQWKYLLIFAIGCTVLPMTLSTWAMKKVSAFAVTLSVNVEPIYTIFWAAYFFPQYEIMKYNFYIGALILVLSVACYPFIKKYFDNSKLVRHSVTRVKYIKRKYTKHY